MRGVRFRGILLNKGDASACPIEVDRISHPLASAVGGSALLPVTLSYSLARALALCGALGDDIPHTNNNRKGWGKPSVTNFTKHHLGNFNARSQICALDLHFSLVSNGWTLDLTKKLSRNSPSDRAQPQPWHGAGRHAGDVVWRRIGASGLPRSCHRRGFPALKMKDTSQQPISSVK